MFVAWNGTDIDATYVTKEGTPGSIKNQILFDISPVLTLTDNADNTLYYPNAEGFKVGAFRSYFQLTDANVSAIVLNFGDGETTGINSIDNGKLTIDNDAWYTLDGRKLQGMPTTKGIYIYNGKKVVIK